MSDYFLWETIRVNSNEAIIDDASAIGEYEDAILSAARQVPFPPKFQFPLTTPGTPADDVLVSGINAVLFSERLVNLLLDSGVDSFDFYPCRLRTNNGTSNPDTYYLIVIRDIIYCLDKENSDLYFLYDDPGGEIDYLLSVCVDEAALDKDHDLLFRLGEGVFNVLVHSSIKDTVEKAGMTGMSFTPADGTYPIVESPRQEEGWLYSRIEQDYSNALDDDDSYCLNANFPVRKYDYASEEESSPEL